MPREGTGEPTLFYPNWGIATMPNGATAEIIGRQPWTPNEKGEPQERLTLRPQVDFNHMYRVTEKEKVYGGFINMIIPVKYIMPLSEDPSNPRYLILCDYRSGEVKTIDRELRKLQIRLETSETLIQSQRIENSKKSQIINKLINEGVDWEELGDIVADKVYTRIIDALFKKPETGQYPMQ